MSGPKYRYTVDAIKAKIASGEVTGEITLGRIRELTGATDSTARRTANELVAEGVLENHPGSPYTVVGTPEGVAATRSDDRPLRVQVADLQHQVADLRRDVPPGLAETLERFATNLEDLYDKLGFEYATDGTSERGDDSAPAARRGRTG